MKTMKRVKMVGVVVIGVLLALALARPMEASPQVTPTSEMAADLEAAARDLHDRPERWSDAARLYAVAADLRQQEDPEARKDLFKAACGPRPSPRSSPPVPGHSSAARSPRPGACSIAPRGWRGTPASRSRFAG
jgi:hypothetical protein